MFLALQIELDKLGGEVERGYLSDYLITLVFGLITDNWITSFFFFSLMQKMLSFNLLKVLTNFCVCAILSATKKQYIIDTSKIYF